MPVEPQHPFNLTPISSEQMDDTAIIKRVMVDLGTDGDAPPTHSVAATPRQLSELGNDGWAITGPPDENDRIPVERNGIAIGYLQLYRY